jgi:hypothetical protein
MRIEPFVVAAALTLGASPAAGQDGRVRFASFDVGLGGVAVRGLPPGLSYGVGADVANLPFAGLSGRFGIRFWSTSRPAGTAIVDVDDTVFELVLKKHLGAGSTRAYVGAGAGAHAVSARLRFEPDVEDPRDGFHPGLQLVLGAETGLGDEFLAAFVEGVGSVMSDVRHVMLQAGVRVRFDRLGER